MTRLQLEHLIRAVGAIADDRDIVVIGSPCVLGQFPDAPSELLISMEADVYARHHPDRSDLIDGAIGEGSPFQRVYGYFAHGIGPETAILPKGWEDRLVPVENENTLGFRGWCLEVHDLAIAKLVAGRDKDLGFTDSLAKHKMVQRDVLMERLAETEADPQLRTIVRGRIERLT